VRLYHRRVFITPSLPPSATNSGGTTERVITRDGSGQCIDDTQRDAIDSIDLQPRDRGRGSPQTSAANPVRNSADISEFTLAAKRRKVPKHDFGHFRSPEQHADGTDRLASRDFLLVFSSDLAPNLNRCRESTSADGKFQEIEQRRYEVSAEPLSLDTTWRKSTRPRVALRRCQEPPSAYTVQRTSSFAIDNSGVTSHRQPRPGNAGGPGAQNGKGGPK